MIEVVSFDVGGTLVTTANLSFTSHLAMRTSLPPEVYFGRAREVLLTTDRFDEETILRLCPFLGLDPRAWPDPWIPAALVPLSRAAEVISAVAAERRVVTLSNVCRLDATDGEIERLFPEVSAVFRSCDVGASKPHKTAFLAMAQSLDVNPSKILHIGDDWRCDVEGALAAGLRAAYIGTERGEVASALDIGKLFDKLRMNGIM